MPIGDTQRRTLVLRVGKGQETGDAIERAAELLRQGGLVAFPTETVYGLGADATNMAAVEGIFRAKERPHSDPLIVHLADASELLTVAAEAPPAAWELAGRCWPGPLTLILPRSEAIPAVVAAGGPTVGVRVPSHPVARGLIRAAGVPVAAPSANRFTHTSPTTAEHVLADLDGRIDCLLDGGPCAVGVESTVLDLTVEPPRVLRPGAVTLEALRELLPGILGPAEASATTSRADMARAPGQMERHYAPQTRLVIFDAQGEAALAALRAEAEGAVNRGERVGALLADEEVDMLGGLALTVERLGSQRDLAEVSRRLYAALRALDAQGLDVILAHTFGTEGLGLAIWDRLRRAAGGEMRQVDAAAQADSHG
ncbi:MAG TPA: L-threonylcarbamoyladenylate synthase [Ktedonobacterales bacterium]|nr:L-threonylcarbamoyladenylate synthase [Ktedonobacterales bacterium]